MKYTITGGIIGVAIGIITTFLLKDFCIWQSEIALRLRPELINLNWWEAFWSGHYIEWMWLIEPNKALILWSLILGITLGYVGVLFGSILDD